MHLFFTQRAGGDQSVKRVGSVRPIGGNAGSTTGVGNGINHRPEHQWRRPGCQRSGLWNDAGPMPDDFAYPERAA